MFTISPLKLNCLCTSAALPSVKGQCCKMPRGSDDARKKFILTSSGNFYGMEPSSSLTGSLELDNFLDDGNQFVLSVMLHDGDLQLSNTVGAVLQLRCVFWSRLLRLMSDLSLSPLPCCVRLKRQAQRRCWSSSNCVPPSSQRKTCTKVSWCRPCWTLQSTPSTRLSDKFSLLRC